MQRIRLLSENLSNKIAAGEVVERPASVVKELVENAIDANSHRVFVSLLDGGVRLIEVSDDGEGMDREDACLAFKRHATSKIIKVEDLTAIRTLGFRGEALPSIASISKVCLKTKKTDETTGSEVRIAGGKIQSIKEIGTPPGSTFEIKDLFYNVPARLKFLKTERTELSYISRIFFNLSLSHPDIHFRLFHGKKRLLDAPRCVSFKDRVTQLFGNKLASDSITVEEQSPSREGLSLQVFLSRPPLKKNHRKEQHLFLNLRPIKSPLLIHAIYEAYGSYLMKGEDPFFVLFLTVNTDEVDINVHPTKQEVRFQNPSQVYQFVRNTVRNTLSTSGYGPQQEQITEAPSLPSREAVPEQNNPGRHSPKWAGWPGYSSEGISYRMVREGAGRYNANVKTLSSDTNRLPGEIYHKESSEEPSLSLTGTMPLIRPLGQVYGTFLLAEIDGDLAVIDQHTAHERILFESLIEAWEQAKKSEKKALEVQVLLFPQQIDLSLSKSSILKDHLNTLAWIGWKIEPFSETTFLIREMPALLSRMNISSFLQDLAEELLELGISDKTDLPLRTIFASMACHGAVRANQEMSLPEIESLLRQYFQKKTPPTCPHGRPIVKTYPLSDMEKLFKRK
ncbi:MAG: DNA mismatch repair endonuclease MutL [Nitrospiria bacterium]